MGLLDSIAGGIKKEAIIQAIQQLVGDKMPDIMKLLKNVDPTILDKILDTFKKNGVPNTKEEITALISKLTK